MAATWSVIWTFWNLKVTVGALPGDMATSRIEKSKTKNIFWKILKNRTNFEQTTDGDGI